MSIKTKLLIPTIVIILSVAVTILLSTILQFSDFVDHTTIAKVEAASRVAMKRLDSLKAETAALSLAMAKDTGIIAALAGKDRDALLARAAALKSDSRAEICTITDAGGRVLARTHAPEEYGDDVTTQENIRSAMGGQALTVIEEGSFTRLSARTGTPVYDAGGALLGIVSVGYRLDSDSYVDSVQELMDCEVTLIFGNERIATTVLGEDGVRIVGTNADADIVETVFAGNTYSGRVDIAGRVAVCQYTPLYGTGGEVFAMIFVGQYFNEELTTIWSFVRGGLAITLVILVVSIVVVLLIVRRIVTPIRAMTQAASALAAGNTELDIQVDTKDEMATLGAAFNRMIENTRRQVALVESIAAGDRTITLGLRSDEDIMNRALEKLNATIKAQAAEIREEHRRVQLLLDATPMVSRLFDRDCKLIECNNAAVSLFGLKDKREYMDRYFELSPEYQPDGRLSQEKYRAIIREAFEKGICIYEWTYQLPDGTPVPAEATMVRVPYGDDFVVAGYSRDLREQQKMLAEIEHRDELLDVGHRTSFILFNMAENEEIAPALEESIALLGACIGASQAYVAQNELVDGELHFTCKYAWVGAGGAEGAFLPGMRFPYGLDADWDERFLAHTCINAPVKGLSEGLQAFFAPFGAKSVLVIPVFVNDLFWGLVGFSDTSRERFFGEDEVNILRSMGLMMATALDRSEQAAHIREAHNRLKDTSAKLETALADAKLANSAKSNFLAQMSHEIRTPLNAVVGLSELALDSIGLAAELEDRLGKIHTAGMTILSIVNDILDISKIESGRFELFPADYDIPSLINDIVTLNMVRIGEKPITFRLFIDENLPGTLHGDDLRVKQIFSNLLSNAFKYTDAGTVEWRLGFERDGDDVWLVSSVKDTGLGMSRQAVEKLFLDYYQVEGHASRRVEGTGLGLAITKRLVDMMDGSITVESTHGAGSTFRVRLRQGFVSGTPIGKAVAENLMGLRYTLSRSSNNKKRPKVDLSYAHVLVVDDIATNLDVVKGMMKPYGLKIDYATSGQQAIEMVRGESPRYSAIFMDHMMPEMDGMEAARIIREDINTDYARKIPIIALTANAIMGNEEMFLSKGFQAFLSKPIDIAKLDAVLRRWVRDKKREQASTPAGACLPAPLAAHGEASRLEGITTALNSMDSAGLDVRRALERFGGSETVFIDVLRSYAVNTRPLLAHLAEYRAADNMEEYAIAVHGIKASSYGIGAQEAGRRAEGLERAAKAGNTEAVQEGHGPFAEVLSALLAEIDRALADIDAAAQKPLAPAPNPALLEQLRNACVAFDMDEVDAAMDALEGFRYENAGELVAWLREKVNIMDFEAVASLDIAVAGSGGVPGAGSHGKAAAPLQNPAPMPDFAAPGANILIVDDNETNLTLALGLLRPLRARMDTAANGEEALRMLSEKTYHLVLMDDMMPVMDGVEATRQLRQMAGGAYKTLPVIALTAREGPGARERLVQAGVTDFAAKPMEMAEIYAKVRACLPKELLREDAPGAAEAPGAHTAEKQDLPALAGIDTREGLRYSRTKELYVSLLGNFYRLIDKKTEFIKDCLTQGLLPEMTIEAHALKNTARMIGARELSEGFARLERYGEAQNVEGLLREAPAVLQQYQALKTVLAPLVAMPQREKRAATGEELLALLHRLASAMEGFDVDGADEALQRLESLELPAQCAQQMEALRAGLAEVDTAATLESVDALIEIIRKTAPA